MKTKYTSPELEIKVLTPSEYLSSLELSGPTPNIGSGKDKDTWDAIFG